MAAEPAAWSTPTPTPVPSPRPPETSALKLPFLGLLWFYRNAISPLDGPRCRMWPTCSAYATQAVRLHGPLLGSMLAADRLMHEGGARTPEYPAVEHYGRTYLADPVSGNDWMFRRETKSSLPTPPLPRGEAESGLSWTAAPPPSTAQSARALAEELDSHGNAWLAATEYRRAAYLSADPASASDQLAAGGWSAIGAMAGKGLRSEEAGGPAEEADRLFDQAEAQAAAVSDPARLAAARYGRAFAHLAAGQAFEALRRFDGLARAEEPDAPWMAAWSELAADLEADGPLSSAVRRFRSLEMDPRHGPDATALVTELSHLRDRRKSPAMAMALNFALPGAGWVYAGRPVIGAGSFLLNGAFIAGAVLAARDGNVPLCLILLSLESGWYFGGAGGAMLEVEDSNREWRSGLQRDLRRRLLGGVGPGGAAAAVLF